MGTLPSIVRAVTFADDDVVWRVISQLHPRDANTIARLMVSTAALLGVKMMIPLASLVRAIREAFLLP